MGEATPNPNTSQDVVEPILKTTNPLTGTMGEATPNPNTSQDVVEPMTFASKLKEGGKINFRRLESENLVDEADVVLPREAVINMKQRFANTLVGPSGTQKGEDEESVEDSGAGAHQMDTFIKEDSKNRMDESEGASTPGDARSVYVDSETEARADLLRKELDDIQIMLDKDPNDCGLREKERACSLEKSLWVEWIYDHKLKGRSFWEVEPRLSMSWGWRKILQVRELIRPYIHQKIGDGKNTFIWSDNWCEYSPLSSFITKRDIYRAGFSTSDKVDELVNDRNWRWPAAWYDLFPVLINIHVPVICNNRRDVSVWHDIYGVEHKFSIHNVWETIRYRSTKVDWYNIVWFTHCIPRHAFHVWLVCRKKLNTQDKMRTWDMNMRCCPLCVKDMDSHDHLFFECEYAIQVWKKVRQFTNLGHIEGVWDNIVSYLNTKGHVL
ncbi:hypothetical protein QVD17_41554 [Tagetes erecta]|uniref:Reverse transcriptase zinc-binding domain-containing protein n=1 Tax=Tagetes erecta TaxID=13708 RepID=A0AAD8NFQ6_TARER|nr:hypothetical protein QVD17_41554 [Tagetes erecta]